MTKHSWSDPHIIRTRKSLLYSIYATLGFFVLLFAFSHIIGSLYVSSIVSRTTDAFHDGISKEIGYLKEQGDAVAEDELLKDRLIAADSNSLIDITKKEIEARAIGLMGVANSEGVMMSRTLSKSSLGQNAFLTTPMGRVVSTEQSVESIEITGFGSQLFMTTARPIMHQGEMIGALFANHLMDDKYATRFRDTYLPPGAEVIFYTNVNGIYGNSFFDQQTRKLINSYFNSGSDWIKKEGSGKTVSFEDDNFYIVENVTFPGLEQSPGGALIFVPRLDLLTTTKIVIAFLTVCFFVFFAMRQLTHMRGQERGWRYYAMIIAASVVVFVLTLSALYTQNIGYLKFERIPYALYNSTLRLQPEFGVYDMGFEQRSSIMVDTGDESINAVQIGLLFDPQMIEVKTLDLNGSECSYVIENKVDNLLGRADLSCVLLETNDGRGSIKIAEVVLIPKKTGTFTLSFDNKDTKVLAADGLATDVLRVAQSGSYTVDIFDPRLFSTSTSTSTSTTPKSFVVFSSSHPNQSRWYNSNEARFVWRGKPGAVYRYAFDVLPDTIPSNIHTAQYSSISIPLSRDGIFYFHLQLVSGGPVAHYMIRVDRTPPVIVGVHLSSEHIVAGDVVRFSFEAEDIASGVQRNFYADLGNHLFLPVGKELSVPFIKAGDQKVVLRVYDGANNYSEKSEIIHVEAK